MRTSERALVRFHVIAIMICLFIEDEQVNFEQNFVYPALECFHGSHRACMHVAAAIFFGKAQKTPPHHGVVVFRTLVILEYWIVCLRQGK